MENNWPPYSMAASGMKLKDLQDTINVILSETDANTRYELRQSPLVLVESDADKKQRFVITATRIDGKNLVLLLNREF